VTLDRIVVRADNEDAGARDCSHDVVDDSWPLEQLVRRKQRRRLLDRRARFDLETVHAALRDPARTRSSSRPQTM
jgi:hypothetical protein